MQASNEETEKILQELLGLQSITDKTLLRQEISSRMGAMNEIEKATFAIKVGDRIRVLEVEKTNAPLSHRKAKKISVLIFAVLAIVGFWLSLSYITNSFFKIVLIIFSALWGLISIRGAYTVFIKKN